MDLSWLPRVLFRDTRQSSSSHVDCSAREPLGTAPRGEGGDPAPVRTHGDPPIQDSTGGLLPLVPYRQDTISRRVVMAGRRAERSPEERMEEATRAVRELELVHAREARSPMTVMALAASGTLRGHIC
jgi:hypothetical protein